MCNLNLFDYLHTEMQELVYIFMLVQLLISISMIPIYNDTGNTRVVYRSDTKQSYPKGS